MKDNYLTELNILRGVGSKSEVVLKDSLGVFLISDISMVIKITAELS